MVQFENAAAATAVAAAAPMQLPCAAAPRTSTPSFVETGPHAPAPPCAAECCIFHRQRQFGEWSDDEDSDAECDECGEGGSQPAQQPQAPPPQA